MRVLIGIQARSNSERFPGKIFQLVEDTPMLLRIYREMEKVKILPKIVETVVSVLVPNNDENTQDFCDYHEMNWFPGHPTDLVDRYAKAVEFYNADIVIRITGDCPLASADLVGAAIKTLLDADYVSNTVIRSYLEGLDVQGCSKEAMKWFDQQQGRDREHLFKTFDENALERERFMHDGFTVQHLFKADNPIFMKVSVDTPEDLKRVNEFLKSTQSQS